jgi:exopolysaccharide biosynthesis polyprenyl glycosylphosphotransferase
LGELAASLKIKTAVLAITENRPASLIKQLLKFRLKGIEILDMPAVYEQLTRRIPVEHIRDEWIIFASGFYLVVKDYIQKIKRLIDFGVSSLLLLITFPLMAMTALAIRLDSAGPVFFKQARLGKDNLVFTLWKFRSMHYNAEENGAVWAEEKDPRITRVGKWIRLLRIDELPQLINVFCGEMSLIGPRPERPEFVRQLSEKIPYYSLRHAIRPGITGWAQVNYRYGASVEDARFKLEYDLYYIKNMSLLLDLKILLRTIGVILFGQGAR